MGKAIMADRAKRTEGINGTIKWAVSVVFGLGSVITIVGIAVSEHQQSLNRIDKNAVEIKHVNGHVSEIKSDLKSIESTQRVIQIDIQEVKTLLQNQ